MSPRTVFRGLALPPMPNSLLERAKKPRHGGVFFRSGRLDSNQRSPAPKAGAMNQASLRPVAAEGGPSIFYFPFSIFIISSNTLRIFSNARAR